MNCETYQDFVAAQVDGGLTPEERQEVEQHLATCPNCRRLFAQESRFRATFAARRLVVPVPVVVEQRLRAALAAEHMPTLSWRGRPSGFLLQPRLAFGLAVAGLLTILVLPRLISRNPDPVWFLQIVDSYQAATEGRVSLTYSIRDPQELEKALNGSGQLDFVTHVLDLRAAGYRLEGGQIVRTKEHPVAVVLYKGEDGPIVCLRQRGMAPPMPEEGRGMKGRYMYSHAGYTVSFVQHPEHFCTLITRIPQETLQRRLGMEPQA